MEKSYDFATFGVMYSWSLCFANNFGLCLNIQFSGVLFLVAQAFMKTKSFFNRNHNGYLSKQILTKTDI